MAFTIETVYENSIAEEIGLKPGDMITKINGEPFIDQIDYVYFMSETELALEILREDGTELIAEIEKTPEEELGVDFKENLMGKKQRCHNKCVFCFVDQLPKGMRDTLYFKDDDWRLSFMMGNYITLSNVPEAEFERILKRKTSPMYISVHATDETVRACMLRNKRGGNILNRLTRLKEAGIHFNTQIVLVPEMNDGAVLKKTVFDLAGFYPYTSSVAVVPVGLTKHRDGLAPIRGFFKEEAATTIETIHRWQAHFLETLGTRFVFAADELYIKAGLPLPEYREYEDFAQIENGVGLVAEFLDDAAYAMETLAGSSPYREVSAVTGVDFAPFLKEVAKKAETKYHVKINVYPIINRFFGESITVAGLLTGRDILAQIHGKPLGEALLIPGNALKEFDDVFLDDITLEQFEAEAGVPCVKVCGGYDFIRAIKEKL